MSESAGTIAGGGRPLPGAGSGPEPSFLEAAERIGARLARDAVWAGRRCTWIGATMDVVRGNWANVERTLGPDLYGGTSGVALFLANLYKHTGEEIFRTTAEGALRQTAARLDGMPAAILPSYYSGLSGIAHVCLAAADALERENLRRQAFDLLRRLRATEGTLEHVDLLGGVAGAIPVLIGAEALDPEGGWMELAAVYGDRIVDAAERRDGMASWGDPGQPGNRHLMGFAHGASGIAWALLELHAVTGTERYLETAQEALVYERSGFNAQEGNWPDLRETPVDGEPREPGWMMAWCHGAPGIGLARLRAQRLLDDPACREEALAAIRSTTQAAEQALDSPYSNYSLCHGLGSYGELLLLAADELGDARPRELAERIGRHGIDAFERERIPWPGGTTGGGDAPGLLLGNAGIGHFLLRLADPSVPSVLLVTPEAVGAPSRRG